MSPMSAPTTPRNNNVTIERILNAGRNSQVMFIFVTLCLFTVKSLFFVTVGTLFGEVALATNNPYFSTVATIG